MIEFYAGLVILGLLLVILSAWMVADKKQVEKRLLEEEQEGVMPLLGVVLPNKKDGNENE
jgi:hypothetical protein